MKGVRTEAHYARQGIAVERLDLRLPSLEHLRLSAILRAVRDAIGGEQDRAVLFGSSLGGLSACRVAEEDARVCALVLLAPALRLVQRWRQRIGEDAWSSWQRSGWLEVEDHAAKKLARVDFGFIEDAAIVEQRSSGWPDVRVPTLIIHGVRDEIVPIALSRAWVAGQRHVRLVEVDDGHELTASLPTILAEADAFLAGFLR